MSLILLQHSLGCQMWFVVGTEAMVQIKACLTAVFTITNVLNSHCYWQCKVRFEFQVINNKQLKHRKTETDT